MGNFISGYSQVRQLLERKLDLRWLCVGSDGVNHTGLWAFMALRWVFETSCFSPLWTIFGCTSSGSCRTSRTVWLIPNAVRLSNRGAEVNHAGLMAIVTLRASHLRARSKSFAFVADF